MAHLFLHLWGDSHGWIRVNFKTALITCFYDTLISAFMRRQSTFRFHRCSRRRFQYFSLLSIEIDLLKFQMGHNVNDLRIPNHRKEDNENFKSSELIQHLEEICKERFINYNYIPTTDWSLQPVANPTRMHTWHVSYEAFRWHNCSTEANFRPLATGWTVKFLTFASRFDFAILYSSANATF